MLLSSFWISSYKHPFHHLYRDCQIYIAVSKGNDNVILLRQLNIVVSPIIEKLMIFNK